MHNELIAVYTEFPRTLRSFIDLYRSFASSLEMDPIINAFLEICTCPQADRLLAEIETASTDFSAALKTLATGERKKQTLALRWLRAEDLPISDFRAIGIGQKINTSDKASRILTALIHMLAASAKARGRPGGRIIWLLDEFQRIERLGRAVINEINTGLHSVFNTCPNGLSLFLSFSGKPDTKLPAWFSPELRDRIGMTRIIVLPPMQESEAKLFLRDLLTHFRSPGYDYSSNPEFPFNREACVAILQEIRKWGEIKPRAIMQAFNAVLEEADPLLEQGRISIIDGGFVKKVLSEHIVVSEGYNEADM